MSVLAVDLRDWRPEPRRAPSLWTNRAWHVDGQAVGVEVKSGNAIRTAAQVSKDIEVARKGGTLVGKNAQGAIYALGRNQLHMPTMVIKY